MEQLRNCSLPNWKIRKPFAARLHRPAQSVGERPLVVVAIVCPAEPAKIMASGKAATCCSLDRLAVCPVLKFKHFKLPAPDELDKRAEQVVVSCYCAGLAGPPPDWVRSDTRVLSHCRALAWADNSDDSEQVAGSRLPVARLASQWPDPATLGGLP